MQDEDSFMKRFILTLFVLFVSACYVLAASPKPDSTVRLAISKYKKGNYAGCIQDLAPYVEDKPSALAYYYLGMAYTQAGRESESVESYDKAIELAEEENNPLLLKYAKFGKLKSEQSDMFMEQESYKDIDLIIKTKKNIPDELKEDLKKKHIEYIRNEINANREPTRF